MILATTTALPFKDDFFATALLITFVRMILATTTALPFGDDWDDYFRYDTAFYVCDDYPRHDNCTSVWG